MSTYQDRARRVLENKFRGLAARAFAEVDGYRPETEGAAEIWDSLLDQALSELASIVEEEIIGEDDKYPAPGNLEYMKVRNQLRAKQRDQIGTIKQLSNRSKSDE